MTKKKKTELTPTTSAPVVKPELTDKEKKVVEAYKAKFKGRNDAPKVTLTNKKGANCNITLAGENPPSNTLNALIALGTNNYDFLSYMLREIIDAACSGNKMTPYDNEDANAVLAAMHAINPNDEIEAMLASQMVSVHFAAMRKLRSFKNSDTLQQQDSNGNLAIKLLRTYTMQLEALNRYRGKGGQQVRVEHVHINEGAQAVIGSVNHAPGGGL